MTDEIPPEGDSPRAIQPTTQEIIDKLLKGVREAQSIVEEEEKLSPLPMSFTPEQIVEIQLCAEYTHEQITSLFMAFNSIAIKSQDSCCMIGFTQAMLQMVRKVLLAVASEKYMYDVFLTTLLGPGVIAAANKAYEAAKLNDKDNS